MVITDPKVSPLTMATAPRRSAIMSRKPGTSLRDSHGSDSTLREHVVIVGDDYEKPQKEMDFPSATHGSPINSKSRTNLRINTYSKTELHDRYMSSEEEPSPSPHSEDSYEDELKHKSSAKFEETAELPTIIDIEAEIAIAVPILALGRPKLVDITNLAPMRKRKQRIPKSQNPHTTFKHHGSRLPAVTDENTPFPANEAAEVVSSPPPKANAALRRKESRPVLTAPESWLPDDAAASAEESSMPRLDVRRTPSYHDYDPYSLEPPRLAACPRGSVARARGNTDPPPTNHHSSGWKGLTRSLSLAKKQHSHRQMTKKPKMIARGANEREDPLVIPPFPFEETGVAA